MSTTNASGGEPAAVEAYSAPTFRKVEAPGFAVFALAGDAELAQGSQLVFVGLFPGKSRQDDVAHVARAKLVELGWSDEDARRARLVSAKPVHFRTTPGLAEPEPPAEAPGPKRSRAKGAKGAQS